MSETYDPVLIGKLLERAGHHRTQDDVALAAVRKASQILDKQGKSLRDVVQPEQDALQQGAFLGHLNDVLAQVKEVEQENKELRQKVADLTHRLSSSPISDYARLRQAVLKRKNVGVYWRDLFKTSTGFDDFAMARWKSDNHVPPEVFDAVEKIDARNYKRPIARSWTFPENTLFRRLLRENKSAFQIATAMSQEFGRAFAVDGITRKMRALSR